MIDKLSSVYKTGGVPLSYMVSKDQTRNVSDVTREEEILHHSSLNGPLFEQDLKNLVSITNEFTIGIPAEAWIKQVMCCRVAMHKSWERYDGKSEG